MQFNHFSVNNVNSTGTSCHNRAKAHWSDPMIKYLLALLCAVLLNVGLPSTAMAKDCDQCPQELTPKAVERCEASCTKGDIEPDPTRYCKKLKKRIPVAQYSAKKCDSGRSGGGGGVSVPPAKCKKADEGSDGCPCIKKKHCDDGLVCNPENTTCEVVPECTVRKDCEIEKDDIAVRDTVKKMSKKVDALETSNTALVKEATALKEAVSNGGLVNHVLHAFIIFLLVILAILVLVRTRKKEEEDEAVPPASSGPPQGTPQGWGPAPTEMPQVQSPDGGLVAAPTGMPQMPPPGTPPPTTTS